MDGAAARCNEGPRRGGIERTERLAASSSHPLEVRSYGILPASPWSVPSALGVLSESVNQLVVCGGGGGREKGKSTTYAKR